MRIWIPLCRCQLWALIHETDTNTSADSVRPRVSASRRQPAAKRRGGSVVDVGTPGCLPGGVVVLSGMEIWRCGCPNETLLLASTASCPAGVPMAPSHHPQVGRTDRGLAPVTRQQRADRSDQQLGQACEADIRVRVPPVRALPHPRSALRRPTQLVTPRPTHPTLKPEAPPSSPKTVPTGPDPVRVAGPPQRGSARPRCRHGGLSTWWPVHLVHHFKAGPPRHAPNR